MNENKRHSAVGKYNGVVIEHYEWSGRGPKRCQLKICTWITPRNGEPYPSWESSRMITWDGELPPVGEPIEFLAKHIAEIYNGALKDEYSLVKCRPRDIPQTHASVPMERGAAPKTHIGPPEYGPPDGFPGADTRQADEQPPPPTDSDSWGF